MEGVSHLLAESLMVLVHSADIQDRDGAKALLARLKGRLPRLRLIWADASYAGRLVDWTRRVCHWSLEIVRRREQAQGFEVLPRRWVEQSPNAPCHKVWLGTFQITLGDVLIRSRQLPEARLILEEAINGLNRLLTDQPEMKFLHGQLARGYSNLAVALRRSGQRETAGQAEQHAQQERDLLASLR